MEVGMKTREGCKAGGELTGARVEGVVGGRGAAGFTAIRDLDVSIAGSRNLK